MVFDENNNDDAGDGLEGDSGSGSEEDAPQDKNQRGGGGEYRDEFEYRDSEDMPDHMLDFEAGAREAGAYMGDAPEAPPPKNDDGFYKIVNVVPPSYGSMGGPSYGSTGAP
jgi:hypothetical protein